MREILVGFKSQSPETWRRELATTSDRKHNSAPNQHRHTVEHSARGELPLRNTREKGTTSPTPMPKWSHRRPALPNPVEELGAVEALGIAGLMAPGPRFRYIARAADVVEPLVLGGASALPRLAAPARCVRRDVECVALATEPVALPYSTKPGRDLKPQLHNAAKKIRQSAQNIWRAAM